MSMMSKEPVFSLIGGMSTFGSGSATSAAMTGRAITSSAAAHAGAEQMDPARRAREPTAATARTVSIGTPFPDDQTADRGHVRTLAFVGPRRASCRRHVLAHAAGTGDRKSTRLNSSHEWISYAVFCLKKKKNKNKREEEEQEHR